MGDRAYVTWRKTGGTRTEVSALAPMPVNADIPKTAFGEVKTSHNTPQVQLKFPYNLNTELGQKLWNNASSTVTTADGLATITCAAAANAFSQIRTRDTIRYGPGQGSQCAFAAAFTTGAANSSQVFGAGDDDEGFFFGYDGADFGVLHRYGGSLEIRHLTITAGADGTGGTFTITLDGDPVTITVQANDTISEVVAAVVASEDFWNAGRGWEVGTSDNIRLEFLSLVAEPAAGSFTFADVDSGVTADAFETEFAGVVPTDTWTSQSNWNLDTFDGNGSSGVTLDHTKLNVYEIDFQFLGAGAIDFAIENPTTGALVKVHRIHYAGTAVVPSLMNPTLHVTTIVKTETGYTGGALVVKTSSMAGFVQGDENLDGPRHSAKGSKNTTGTTPACVLAINNHYEFQGKKNKVTAYPDYMTIASEAGKTVTIEIIRNPTQIDGTATMVAVDADHTAMQYSTGGTTVVGGRALVPFILEGADSKEIDLKNLNLHLRPDERWAITASLSSGADALVTVGLTWIDRV